MTPPSEHECAKRADLAGRAAAALGTAPTAPTATAAAARSAFLRRLTATGFVPPAEWRSAVRVLTGSPPLGPAALADPLLNAPADDSLCADIETFATSYWALGPVERRRRWQSLLDRCSFEPALV